jgi:hypothetical protein
MSVVAFPTTLQSALCSKAPNQTVGRLLKPREASMPQRLMREIRGRGQGASRQLTKAVTLWTTCLFFIALIIGGFSVLNKRAILHAPTVDVSKVRSHCGQAVEVTGWVSARGANYYIVSRKGPDPVAALDNARHAFDAQIFVLVDSSEVRKRSSLTIGTKVSVRGLVDCDPEGVTEVEEEELVVSERP